MLPFDFVDMFQHEDASIIFCQCTLTQRVEKFEKGSSIEYILVNFKKNVCKFNIGEDEIVQFPCSMIIDDSKGVVKEDDSDFGDTDEDTDDVDTDEDDTDDTDEDDDSDEDDN